MVSVVRRNVLCFGEVPAARMKRFGESRICTVYFAYHVTIDQLLKGKVQNLFKSHNIARGI